MLYAPLDKENANCIVFQYIYSICKSIVKKKSVKQPIALQDVQDQYRIK